MEKRPLKALIIENDSFRIKSFRERFAASDFAGSFTVTYVRTVPEAIWNLEQQAYDVIFLDHDLEDASFDPTDEDSGHAIAEHIAANRSDFEKTRIIIHSLNAAGAGRMQHLLPYALRKPNVWEPRHQSFYAALLDPEK